MRDDRRAAGKRDAGAMNAPRVGAYFWDPLAAWPQGRVWLWVLLAIFAAVVQGPDFVRSLKPDPELGNDFYQEWASARNVLNGLPAYLELEVMAGDYLGYGEEEERVLYLKYNAHPPTSVLLGIPFAFMSYPVATLYWNLLSLIAFGVSFFLIGRGLGLRFKAWVIFPAVVALLLCNPFRQQVNQGQLNLILLLLVTVTWLEARAGRSWWAGLALALATAIKLYPGFLFLFFALRRQWNVVGIGIAALAGITGLTVAILGPGAYRDYVMIVLPAVSEFRSGWPNGSLQGFWLKLFDTGAVHYDYRVEPLWERPIVSRIGWIVSCVIVLSLWGSTVIRAKSRWRYDLAFGLSLTTMLLLSPISWDHYLLVLVLPLAQIWMALPAVSLSRFLYIGILMLVWVNPIQVWLPFFPEAITMTPVQASAPFLLITVLCYHTYVLLGLFGLGLMIQRPERCLDESIRATGPSRQLPTA